MTVKYLSGKDVVCSSAICNVGFLLMEAAMLRLCLVAYDSDWRFLDFVTLKFYILPGLILSYMNVHCLTNRC